MTEGMKVRGAATTAALLGRTSCRVVFGAMFSERIHMSRIKLLAKKRKISSPVLDFDALEAELMVEGGGLGAPVLTSTNNRSSRDTSKKNKKNVRYDEKNGQARNARPISAKKKKPTFGVGGMRLPLPIVIFLRIIILAAVLSCYPMDRGS